VQLSVLPAQGMLSVAEPSGGLGAFGDYLQHLILPGFAITVSYMAIVARVAGASFTRASREDFVLLALAKGLSKTRVFWTHVVPNGLIPVVTVIGYNFSYALTGAILTETVFGWPGVGYLFITSIQKRDYPVLDGIFLVATVTVILANLLTDLSYAVIDPRVRLSYSNAR
jgi:ABC-type dipeptide/oligopeptide/nickel transport system permease component